MRDRSTGPWDELTLCDGRGAVATIRIRRSGRRRLWTWSWQERYLGKTTLLRAPCGFRDRRHCLFNLQDTLEYLGWPGLARQLEEWEEE